MVSWTCIGLTLWRPLAFNLEVAFKYPGMVTDGLDLAASRYFVYTDICIMYTNTVV